MGDAEDQKALDRAEQQAKNIGAMGATQPAQGVRGYLHNMDLDPEENPLVYIEDVMDFLFRPAQVREALSVAYDSMQVIGMSHESKAYSHTANVPFSFDLYFNALMFIKNAAMSNPRVERKEATGFGFNPEGTKDQLRAVSEMIEEHRRYLEALCYPAADPTGGINLAPPFCILCLPGIVTLRCKLMSVEFTFLDSDIRGFHKEMRASCTFENHPQNRVTMQDVLATGMFSDMR